jgi:DNA repair protein RecN (Recombination protein N)
VELLRYQIEEIEAAKLQPGELDELETERRRLANAERLGELCMAAHTALAGDAEDDALGAIDLLAQAQRSLTELRRVDDALAEQEGTLEQALFLAQDVAAAITSYQDEIAADPRRQAVVEERLDLIAKLRRKYGATIEEILSYAAEAGHELDELTHREERMSELQERDRSLRAQIGVVASELSHRRQAAATELAAAMERELDDLNMRRARFQVHITQTAAADGVPADPDASEKKARRDGKVSGLESLFAFGPTGIDSVELLIAPNPGEPLKPLAKIASGGETSRLMLALKTILSRADLIPILIFDEIDAGISGRSGQTVGEKLWQLGQSHQVLCVTHLPQIAAVGDCHYRVAKALSGERTTTSVQALADADRIAELSQMLGGARTAAAEANANELLARARVWKHDEAGCPSA